MPEPQGSGFFCCAERPLVTLADDDNRAEGEMRVNVQTYPDTWSSSS